MTNSSRFELAKEKILEQISNSKNPEDSDHAQNTMDWIVKLRPNADEILQLAGLAHDIQRATPDRLKKELFSNYDEYLTAHARRSSEIAADIVRESGYSSEEVSRLEYIIANGEFHNTDPDIQLLRDANTISIFDSNTSFYLKNNGDEWTRQKMKSNYDRASNLAKEKIKELLRSRPEHNLLNL